MIAAYLGNVLYLILLGFLRRLPKCCFFRIWKHDHYNVSPLTVIFLRNKLNCSLIRCCWNVYRIYAYKHYYECKKENYYLEWRIRALWHDESENFFKLVIVSWVPWSFGIDVSPRIEGSILVFVGWWCGFHLPRSYLTLILKENKESLWLRLLYSFP